MSKGPRMRISLSQRGDEIGGTIELPGDGVFVLEGLALVLDQFSKQHNRPLGEVIRDLYSVAAGKVTS